MATTPGTPIRPAQNTGPASLRDVQPPARHVPVVPSRTSVQHTSTPVVRRDGRIEQIQRSLQETHERALARQADELRAVATGAAGNISKPSLVRYAAYGSACILADIFGIIVSALNLTGIALVITFVANLFLIAFLWAFGRLLLGKRAWRNREARKQLEGYIEVASRDARQLQTQMARFQRYAQAAIQRSPRLAAAGARLTRRAVRLTRARPVARGISFITRIFGSTSVRFIAEAIPFVQVLPWWTIGAIAIYIEHRTEYRNAQQALQDYEETKQELAGMVDDLHGVQRGTIDDELIVRAVPVV